MIAREDIAALRRQVAAIRRLHFQYRGPTDPDSCAECNRLAGFEVRWPCPTIAALTTAAQATTESIEEKTDG